MLLICYKCSRYDRYLAERALEFDFKPVIDALAVKLVRAAECLDHLSCLQRVYANRTVRAVLLLARAAWRGLLVAEGRIGIYDVPDFLRGQLLLGFFLLELLGELRWWVRRVEAPFFIIVLFLIILLLLIGMILRTTIHLCIESITCKIHLNVRWKSSL